MVKYYYPEPTLIYPVLTLIIFHKTLINNKFYNSKIIFFNNKKMTKFRNKHHV